MTQTLALVYAALLAITTGLMGWGFVMRDWLIFGPALVVLWFLAWIAYDNRHRTREDARVQHIVDEVREAREARRHRALDAIARAGRSNGDRHHVR